MSARLVGWGLVALLAAAVALAACVSGGRRSGWERPAAGAAPTDTAPGAGTSIVVGGRHVDVGAPVVLWFDPGGYSAYSRALRFPDEAPDDPSWQAPTGLRYKPGRETERGKVTRRSTSPEIAEVVDQLVLHYDVCGLARTCFKVLHDRRELSVHFLLDVDGTLYQTMDLADTAWHARQANARSVGVEIASIGAYPPGPASPLDDPASPLDEWYARDGEGERLVLPAGPTGVRTPGFVGRPLRPGRLQGVINGQTLEMHDFTPEQYETLERLTAALCRVFPRIAPEAPRDAAGRVRTDVLPASEYEAFGGILGHHHLTEQKVDPGPAFDWERYLLRVRALLQGAPRGLETALARPPARGRDD